MEKLHNALGIAQTLAPSDPVTLIRPHAAHRAARCFVEKFPGRTLYAVKANPSPALLQTLWDAGISHYDVASIREIRQVRALLPQSVLCFMHPVKSREAIAEAYHTHGVRVFSLDSHDELDKIVAATDGAEDLTLCVRLRVGSDHARISLGRKFGVPLKDSASLLLATRQVADVLGLCFHVGSQCMSPHAYSDAMENVRDAIVTAGVTVDLVDVGGGFPSLYPGMMPMAMQSYFDVIHRTFEELPISYSADLWCEPGRALCAEYASVLVRVERRIGDHLFINDGAYGSLFDAAHIGWRHPARLIRARETHAPLVPFGFYGPTCDDIDQMDGPFELPQDVAANDYIELGMLGAYGQAMRTQFNGFGHSDTHIVTDDPMLSAYMDEKDARFGSL